MLTGFKLKRLWLLTLLLPAAAATFFAAKYPAATERIYSAGIYPALSGLISRLTGLAAFSLAEFVVIVLPISIITYIIVKIRKIIKQPDKRRAHAARLISTLLCAAVLIYFGFTFLCGLNYHRETFAVSSGLSVRDSSSEELAKLCAELVKKTNLYASRVKRDENKVMLSGFDNPYEAARFASRSYATAAAEYPILSGYTPPAKPVFFSRAMSMADLVGVYFPFTFEANVNIDVPAYEIPSSMMHELAHYKGFMREDEANFIAYRTCVLSGNDDFAYSGLMLALVHSTNALYSAEKDAYWNLTKYLDSGVLADLAANTAYWKQFEGPVADFSEKVNDVYLKTNRQAAGVKSYGRMVDLLLAQYREDHGLE